MLYCDAKVQKLLPRNAPDATKGVNRVVACRDKEGAAVALLLAQSHSVGRDLPPQRIAGSRRGVSQQHLHTVRAGPPGKACAPEGRDGGCASPPPAAPAHRTGALRRSAFPLLQLRETQRGARTAAKPRRGGVGKHTEPHPLHGPPPGARPLAAELAAMTQSARSIMHEQLVIVIAEGGAQRPFGADHLDRDDVLGNGALLVLVAAAVACAVGLVVATGAGGSDGDGRNSQRGWGRVEQRGRLKSAKRRGERRRQGHMRRRRRARCRR